jgi:hypothetical protein
MARKQEKQNRKRRSSNLTEEAREENQPLQEESQPIQVAKGDPGGGGLSRCPVTHWMSELPSLYEPECTNMLQSKAILAEVSSLSSLVMDNLRRVQSQGLEVTRLFAAICRYLLSCSRNYALQRKSHLSISRKGIARPQSRFPLSCVCEQFIYTQDLSHIFQQQNR